MSRLYTSANKIRFTSLSESYKVEQHLKGKLSELYSNVITYVVKHFDGTIAYKKKTTQLINVITYHLYAAEPLPFDWERNNPFKNMPVIEVEVLEDVLGDIYLTYDAIDWDIAIVDAPIKADYVPPVADASLNKVPVIKTPLFSSASSKSDVLNTTYTPTQTPSSDLYIQCPEYPQFDVNKPWLRKQCGPDLLTIYTTLPEVPKRQRDISITTDISKMGTDDLMGLFPNHIIHTRASALYQPQTNMDYDEVLGVIPPIDGYTKEQVIDNIIQYPHFYKLVRECNMDSFYAYMEVDGELKSTLDVWDSLDIAKWIPKNSEFIKDYLVRKYLLDRDIGNIAAKYPMFGTLNPFLTLFMPASEYEKRGYDPLDIARKCVESRISYKQSRSPIIRRIRESE